MSTNNLDADSNLSFIPDTVRARGTINPETYHARGNITPGTWYVGGTITPVIISSFLYSSRRMTETEGYDSNRDDSEVERITITPEALMPDLDMNIAATIHELVRNPLYNMYNKSSKVFAFLILNLIVLGWMNVFPWMVIMPAISGLTMLSLIFFYEMRVRKFVAKKII